jgi:hypothetical protein
MQKLFTSKGKIKEHVSVSQRPYFVRIRKAEDVDISNLPYIILLYSILNPYILINQL